MKIRTPLLTIALIVLVGLATWFSRETRIQPKQASPAKPWFSSSQTSDLSLSGGTVAASTPPVLESTEPSPPEATGGQHTAGSITGTGVSSVILQKVEEERVPKVDIQIGSLLFAVKSYEKYLGSKPPANDSRSLAAALMGKNERGIVFIEGYGWTNNEGEFADPWGMPYSFNLESNAVTVRSAGPNRLFGDTDDVVRVKQDGK
jgi:hypothetical protein